uniref:Retrotransposon gag domain-containing protein n=1 Tax=Photinus pyralis TaxID=7054 RepID=A0A1Y1NJV4_PHOPY
MSPITRSAAKAAKTDSASCSPASIPTVSQSQFLRQEEELLAAFRRLKLVPDPTQVQSDVTELIPQPTVIAPSFKPKAKRANMPKARKSVLTTSLLSSLANDIKSTNDAVAQIAIHAPSYHSIKFAVDSKQLISNVPNCSHNDPQSIVLFIESVDKLLKFPKVDFLSLLVSLAVKVDDQIREWWSTMMHHSWSQLRNLLFTKYVNRSDVILLCDRFIHRLQRENETFEAFVLDIKSKSAAMNLNYPESHLISLIWAHCNRQTFGILKFFPEPLTFLDLDSVIQKIESTIRREKGFTLPSTVPARLNDIQRPQVQPSDSIPNGSRFCRYCRNYGHSIDNCFKRNNKREGYPKN